MRVFLSQLSWNAMTAFQPIVNTLDFVFKRKFSFPIQLKMWQFKIVQKHVENIISSAMNCKWDLDKNAQTLTPTMALVLLCKLRKNRTSKCVPAIALSSAEKMKTKCHVKQKSLEVEAVEKRWPCLKFKNRYKNQRVWSRSDSLTPSLSVDSKVALNAP